MEFVLSRCSGVQKRTYIGLIGESKLAVHMNITVNSGLSLYAGSVYCVFCLLPYESWDRLQSPHHPKICKISERSGRKREEWIFPSIKMS